MDVADIANGLAHDLVDRDNRFEVRAFRQVRNSNFTADNDDVALGVRFARDAAAAILPQTGVQNGIGDRVANFIGMTFANGFGSKNETSKHKEFRFRKAEIGPSKVGSGAS